MDKSKFIFILVIALFAAAVISAFGAETSVIISTANARVSARRGGKVSILKHLRDNTKPASNTVTTPNNNTAKIPAPANPPAQAKPSNPAAPAVDVKRQMALLDSRKPEDRISAANTLSRAKAQAAAGKLAGMMGTEKNTGVRINIANSLGYIAGAASVKQLIVSSKQDQSADVRAMSCLALGQSEDKSAIDALKGILSNNTEKPNVRVSAGASLIIHFIGEPGVKEALANVLASGENDVRFGIVDNLRHAVNKPEANDLLNTAKNDKDENIRNLAAEIAK